MPRKYMSFWIWSFVLEAITDNRERLYWLHEVTNGSWSRMGDDGNIYEI